MKKYLPLFLIVLIISLCLQFGCDKDEPIMSGLPVIVPPTQIAPANGAVVYSDSIEFKWRKVVGVTGYTLQIARDSIFSSFVYNQSDLSDTSKQIFIFTNPHAYFWRVNSVLYNTVTLWSTVRRFTKVVIMNVSCPSIPTVSYAGKIYNTVQIGNQCWLKENLDIGTMIQGTDTAKNNGTIEKYCYNNDTNNCVIHGGLYQWDEAMQYTSTEGVRGICPSGWHLPTIYEFQTLSTAVGGDGNALKAIGQGTYDGVGTDISGFSALISGGRRGNGVFNSLGNDTWFWSSTNSNANIALGMYLASGYTGTAFYFNSMEDGFSVRCIKD